MTVKELKYKIPKKRGEHKTNLQHFSREDEYITPAGKQAVLEYLDRIRLPQPNDDFQWVWMTPAGKFTKRLAKYYYLAFKHKLTSEDISQIGNLAKNHFNQRQEYWYDIDYSLDWHAGDFGDNGSCFWGNHEGARLAMQNDNRFFAFRLFQKPTTRQYLTETFQGFARCWGCTDDRGFVVLFNAYSSGYWNVNLIRFARLFASINDMDYQQVRVRNSTHWLLYLNSGNAYAVGPTDIVRGLNEYDFALDCSEYETQYYCYQCDEPTHEDEAHLINGNVFCDYCFDTYYGYCHRCDEPTLQDELFTTREGEWVCDYCADTYYTTCAECGQITNSAAMIDSEQYCPDCYCYCQHCDNPIVRGYDCECEDNNED